jgi:hypothetical protein
MGGWMDCLGGLRSIDRFDRGGACVGLDSIELACCCSPRSSPIRRKRFGSSTQRHTDPHVVDRDFRVVVCEL